MTRARRLLALLTVITPALTLACSTDDSDGNSENGAEVATGPYLLAGGIGVTDLAASFDFYSAVLGMALRYDLQVPAYADEKILHFPDGKASDLVLMHYTDGKEHGYVKNPVKLVFYVPSATRVVDAVRARGLQVIAEPAQQAAFGNVTVGFARDPDGYVLELIEDTTLAVPYLGAVGIGVSDLARSTTFYTGVLGMEPMGDVIQVPGVWDEIILRYPSGKGSSVVLLHYTDGSTRNYVDNPIKLVHRVPDVKESLDAIAAAGSTILTQPLPFTANGTTATVGLAKDPDGYTLELLTPE